MLQVTLLDDAPFEAVHIELPLKSKPAKDPSAKNTLFIPVPDSGEIPSCLACYTHSSRLKLSAITLILPELICIIFGLKY